MVILKRSHVCIQINLMCMLICAHKVILWHILTTWNSSSIAIKIIRRDDRDTIIIWGGGVCYNKDCVTLSRTESWRPSSFEAGEQSDGLISPGWEDWRFNSLDSVATTVFGVDCSSEEALASLMSLSLERMIPAVMADTMHTMQNMKLRIYT